MPRRVAGTAQPRRLARTPTSARRAEPGRRCRVSRLLSLGLGVAAAAAIQVVSAHAAGGGRVRRDGRLPAARGRRRARPAPPARVRRGVARGGRQPGLRRTRGHVAARRARRRSAPAGPGRCGRRSTRSPSTTRSPAGSATASTGSRTGWPTRSATGSSRGCGSPARSAAVSSAACCATCPAYLRDDARTRSELESRQAWTVNGARLAVAAPWLVLLLMSFQSDVIRRYASPAGVVVLGARRGPVRHGLPADDADRPAARRAADPVVSRDLVGRRARGARGRRPAARGRSCAWRSASRSSPPGCCPTSATCPPAVDRAGVPRAGAVQPTLGGSSASSARCCAPPPTRWSGCSAARRPSAAGSSAPRSTRRVHDFRVEQVVWGLVGFAAAAAYCAAPHARRTPAASRSSLLLCVARLRRRRAAPRDNHLTAQVKQRERRILAEFPTIAELLALAVAAGESPVAALDRVVPPQPRRAVRRPRPGARRRPHRRTGRAAPSTRWPRAPACPSWPGSPRASRSRSSAAPRWPTSCTPRPPTYARPAARADRDRRPQGGPHDGAGRVPRAARDGPVRVLARRVGLSLTTP